MTTSKEIDGVPRYIGEAGIVGLYYPARCTECGWLGSSEDLTDEAECTRHEGDSLCLGYTEEVEAVYLLGVIQAMAKAAAQPPIDPVLCKFYDVSDWPALVRELVGHVAQLQDSAKRNVKPWEDTFPPTLLPAYIERVNAANESAQAQAYRLLGDGDVIEEGDETLNDDTATWGKQPMGIFLGMPYNRRVMLPVRRAISA